VNEKLVQVDEVIRQFDKLEDRVFAAIKQVFDPEIPVNIYDLGLIYEVKIDEQKNVAITMTLTSAACPAAHEIPVEVQRNVARVPEVKDVEVDVVFDPPWSQDRMSDEAKLMLGLL
jgi:FeS assembly SUF system protein